MCTEKFGLNAQNISVAAAEMEHRFDLGFLLNQLAGDLRAESRAGAWTVRYIDAVNAVLLTETGTGDLFRRIDTPRRKDFNERDKLAGSQFPAEQLTPITSTGHSFMVFVNVSVLAPPRRLPSSSTVSCATITMSGPAASRAA